MNYVLERINQVCINVRKAQTITTFKKLILQTRKEFRRQGIDLKLRTKRDKTLDERMFYVVAFYDPDDDLHGEIPIEVIVTHNFLEEENFKDKQITEFLIQIFDAVVHEFRHQQQSKKRKHITFSHHEQEPYSRYLADPDELDAYALSIAIELLRVLPKYRAEKYMTRLETLSRLRKNSYLISPTLNSYVSFFHNNNLLRKLSKKIYKHLETLDTSNIFQ